MRIWAACPVRPVHSVCLLAAAALIAGCSSTISGHGQAATGAAAPSTTSSTNRPPTSPAPPASTTAASTTAASTTQPPTTQPSTTQPARPTSQTPNPPSAVPSGAPPPATCPEGGCTELSYSSVKDTYQIVLRQGGSGTLGTDTVVELTRGGVPVGWAVQPDTYTARMNCSTKTEHLHCVVTTGVGAHAEAADLYLAVDGGFVHPPTVVTDTSGIEAADLDGDGDLDLAVPVNDYQPDYADGGVYFQTFLLQHQAYVLTGCSPTVRNQFPPTPTGPLHGSCPG